MPYPGKHWNFAKEIHQHLKYIADTFLSVVPVDFSGGDLQWKGCLGSYLSIICVLALYILKVNNIVIYLTV